MGKISKSTLNKVRLRTQGCQFAHNYERMQSLSLTYCFAPVLEELYKDAPKEERVNAMKRHLEYFNTHPLAIPFILGITAALEESTDEDQKDTVVGIKTSLMGPFAGLGDSLLNLTWFPIAGSIGASMCVDNGSIVGPLVMFLLINLLYWPLKYFGLHKGYEMGMELVESIGASMCVDNGSIVGPLVMFLLINLLYWPLKYFGLHKGYEMGMELVEKAGVQVFDRLGNLANVLGVMVTGGLVATTVKLKLAVQFAFGEGDPLVLQDQLDFDRLGNLANVLGVMVTGGLVATTVKLKLAVQFAFGEGDPLVLQDQLDKVLPFLLPVVLTFICYRLLKKGQGKNSAQIIIGLIVFSLVFAAIGFYFPAFKIFA